MVHCQTVEIRVFGCRNQVYDTRFVTSSKKTDMADHGLVILRTVLKASWLVASADMRKSITDITMHGIDSAKTVPAIL